MYIAGVKSFVVCSLVAVFIGMILSLQAGIELQKFQQQSLVGDLVITTMTREMGPLMTGVIIIASVGSAIAAEIGTMKVSEEIDASGDDVNKSCKIPCNAEACCAFNYGSHIDYICYCPRDYRWSHCCSFSAWASLSIFITIVLYQALRFKATYVGVFKSFIFGIIIAAISCAQGLRAENGAMGVGKATRSTVVASFLMVLITGYFITSFFYGQLIMIELVNIYKSFNGLKVLNGISVKIKKGETFVIIGQSGTGKTVTLRHISGLTDPDSGDVLIEGVKMNRAKSTVKEKLRKRMGIVFQSGALINWMTVRDNIALPDAREQNVPSG